MLNWCFDNGVLTMVLGRVKIQKVCSPLTVDVMGWMDLWSGLCICICICRAFYGANNRQNYQRYRLENLRHVRRLKGKVYNCLRSIVQL